jgi:hypothetical protein
MKRKLKLLMDHFSVSRALGLKFQHSMHKCIHSIGSYGHCCNHCYEQLVNMIDITHPILIVLEQRHFY